MLRLNFLIIFSVRMCAQFPNKEAVIQKLESTYALTQPTADNSDIVTAGAVLVLKKNAIEMNPVSSPNPYPNSYKEGRLTQNVFGRTLRSLHSLSGIAAAPSANRTFVRGEKMWVTNIEIRDDGVVFSLLSDPFGEVRYKANVRFVLEKGSTRTFEEVARNVAEVFRVLPTQQQTTDAPSTQPNPQRARPVVLRADPDSGAQPPAMVEAFTIAPPPGPPPDTATGAVKSVSVGQTADQVMEALGQPKNIVDLGKKKIYVYAALKVTFTDGRVSNVE